jgi:hypothetical protein
MFLGQPLARAMNGMTGRRPLTKTQEHLIEQMRDRQAYDAANTTNTIGDSPANAANTNAGCSTTVPCYGVGDSRILS